MKLISSIDNKIFKETKELLQKKYRGRSGLYLVEGEKLVGEAVRYNRAKRVILREDYEKKTGVHGVESVFMTGKLFSKVAQTETSQGIIAVVSKEELGREAFVEKIREDEGNVIVLDGLQDPGNIGTIIRTADAAGYKGAVFIKGTVDVYSPKVVRSAAGSLLRLPLFHAESVKDAVDLLKGADKQIVGTSLRSAVYYHQADLTQNCAVVIGNEGNGMSEEFLAETDFNIKIPMEGEIESLNAAVAAGILMYQSVKKG
ncbi:MAG: RNA methyltransferase [Anaerovoracaceae bacterium]